MGKLASRRFPEETRKQYDQMLEKKVAQKQFLLIGTIFQNSPKVTK